MSKKSTSRVITPKRREYKNRWQRANYMSFSGFRVKPTIGKYHAAVFFRQTELCAHESRAITPNDFLWLCEKTRLFRCDSCPDLLLALPCSVLKYGKKNIRKDQYDQLLAAGEIPYKVAKGENRVKQIAGWGKNK